MKYKNTRTGAVLDSPCIIKGGNWTEIEDDTITLSEMTITSLKKFAIENNIDLGKATKRDDIIKVITESDAVEIE